MQVATYSWEEMLAIQGRAAREWPWHRRLPTLAFRGNAGMGNLRRTVRDAMVAWRKREVAQANMSRSSIGSGEGHSSSSSSSDLGAAAAGSGGGEDGVPGNGTAAPAPVFDIILDENIHWSKDLLGLYDHCRSAQWICRCLFLLVRGTVCLFLCLRHVASATIVGGISCICRTP